MEKKVHEIKTVHDYNAWIGVPDEHPLICIVNFDELDQVRTDTSNTASMASSFAMPLYRVSSTATDSISIATKP